MKKYPSKQYLDTLISYCPDTGVFKWKKKLGGGRSVNMFNALYAGKVAGSILKAPRSKTSYVAIKIDGHSYKAHRLAFVLMGEPIPLQVDHIDHDGMNNRWENLRPSHSKDNSKNLPMQKSNKTGVIGVNWHKAARKWQARAVDENGKRIDLGRYESFDAAVKARKEHEKKFKYYHYRGDQ